MQLNGNGGNGGWNSAFKFLIGLDLDEFVESQIKDGETVTMMKVFDHVSGKESYDKAEESVCKGGSH